MTGIPMSEGREREGEVLEIKLKLKSFMRGLCQNNFKVKGRLCINAVYLWGTVTNGGYPFVF